VTAAASESIDRKDEANMQESPLTLSVITVSWNSGSFLPECIRSVAESAGPLPYEHILVDNASEDDGAGIVERDFPEVGVIRNDDNVGFARANNAAARLCRGRYILFLNPDTKVVDDALRRMIAVMEARPDIGALGPKLLNADLRWSRDMGYRVPTLRTVVNEFLGLSQLVPYPRLVPGIVRSRDFDGLEDCGWVSGAAFMVSRALLEQELWNEDIFFFGEDIEYCDRIRKRGWSVCATADARIIHYSGQSMSKQSVEFLAGRSSGIAMYLKKTQGPLAAWAAVKVVRAGYLLRILFHRIRYRLSGDEVSLRKSQRLQQYSRLDSDGSVNGEQ
jgi:GT2 family glycosyltransferase